ncbi:hypothetical protein P692DRAFT_20829774 [Suillus brevipes Sb2]|nr:hypothetical protein P692DRAFT_20829774 [Suillus brevipes Sb2]
MAILGICDAFVVFATIQGLLLPFSKLTTDSIRSSVTFSCHSEHSSGGAFACTSLFSSSTIRSRGRESRQTLSDIIIPSQRRGKRRTVAEICAYRVVVRASPPPLIDDCVR